VDTLAKLGVRAASAVQQILQRAAAANIRRKAYQNAHENLPVPCLISPRPPSPARSKTADTGPGAQKGACHHQQLLIHTLNQTRDWPAHATLYANRK